MNAPTQLPAVETRTPYRFTFEEVLRMVEGGVLLDQHVELIEGELIQVSPESLPHVRYKRWLTAFFIRALDQNYEVTPDSPLVLTRFTAPEPDIYIFPSSINEAAITGPDLSLVIEVAASSLLNDLRLKSVVYARYGVAEYWVVDVDARRLWVHRDPQGDAYDSVISYAADERITPLRLPGLSFGLCDLPG